MNKKLNVEGLGSEAFRQGGANLDLQPSVAVPRFCSKRGGRSRSGSPCAHCLEDSLSSHHVGPAIPTAYTSG